MAQENLTENELQNEFLTALKLWHFMQADDCTIEFLPEFVTDLGLAVHEYGLRLEELNPDRSWPGL